MMLDIFATIYGLCNQIKKIQPKTIDKNGIYNASDDNCDAFNPITVNIPEPVIQSKNISENGIFKASDDGCDGFNEVLVDVKTYEDGILAEISISTTAAGNTPEYVSGGRTTTFDLSYWKVIPIMTTRASGSIKQ